MKREDLRSRIIPTTIENISISNNKENVKSITTDALYLDSFDDQFDNVKTDIERRISATDYAKRHNAYIDIVHRTRTGRKTTWVWLRSAYHNYYASIISEDGDWRHSCTRDMDGGICPSLHYRLPSGVSTQSKLHSLKESKNRNESEELEQLDIKEVKDIEGETIYHTLQIGEYPKTKVDEHLSKKLESLYNGGKIQEGILCTGRWFSGNGQKQNYKDYAGKHEPEFEYQGERYVRTVAYPKVVTPTRPVIVSWEKVEPISFVINNWDEMPKSINPRGNGRAKYFNLRAEEAVTSNIPFYPDEEDENSQLWPNSSIRGYLNGIDVRNIGPYGAGRGGNFTGECNFLNEAFNLSREPIVEYTIPDSETEIPDDAFNGCITLKKLVIHSKIKSIGKRAFDGLNFKYAYKTEKGELVFSQDMPQNKDEYKNIIEFDKIKKCFDKFNYNILLHGDKLDEVISLTETLSKNKFSIPYVYGLALVESEKTKSFYENSDFRFFKNEIPKINDMLLEFPEEERLDFFKFANSLGCFSLNKLLDKKGKKTEIPLAQKASSLLATILKTDEMKLR